MSHGLAIPRSPTPIVIADGANLDAFSRLRVSNAQTLFDVQCQYNTEALQMESGNTSDGVMPAHSSNTRMVELKVAAGATGGTSFMQSYRYVPYQPGKSQLIAITGVMGAGTAGAVKRFGYGDAANGIFFEQDGTNGLRLNRRTSTGGSVSDNYEAQAAWNLDPLNGSGPSGITLNVANSFILFIDLQFLGMGRVRVGFDIGGELVYVHEFLNANVLTVPYMQTASLPVLAEIIAAAGLAGDATMHFKCAQVASEGGFEDIAGRAFSAEGTATAGSGTRTHILSIRPLTTFAGLTNRIFNHLKSVEVLGGSNPVYWELVVGAAFSAGPTWATVNSTHSGMQVGTAGTFSNLTNGIVIDSGYVANANAASRDTSTKDLGNLYPITLDRAGAVRDLGTITLLVTGIGGTSACRACFNWHEIR